MAKLTDFQLTEPTVLTLAVAKIRAVEKDRPSDGQLPELRRAAREMIAQGYDLQETADYLGPAQ